MWWVIGLVGCGGPGDAPEPPGRVPPAERVVDPGSRPAARLNRAEYDATLRDLFGTAKTPSEGFPPDEVAWGFDNVAEALGTTSIHVELWEAAAQDVLDELFGRDEETTTRYGAQAEAGGVTYLGEGQLYDDTWYAVFSGSLSTVLAVEGDGRFRVGVQAFGRAVDGEAPVLEVRVDGVPWGERTVTATPAAPARHDLEGTLDEGVHTFEVAILNPGTDAGGVRRSITVDWIEVEGPLDPQQGRTEAWDRWVPCAPDGFADRDCASYAIERLGEHAWRRPLTPEDRDWALSLYDRAIAAGGDEDEALQLAFQGLLLAPEFLYRIEPPPPEGQPWRALDGHEVATRLAAFLWASTPDEALLAAAADGSLLAPGGIEAQVVRMRADPRASALIDHLAGQWLDLRKIANARPDPVLYPDFDEALRASMRQELAFLAEGFFLGDGELTSLMTEQTTWIDARLAEHYGFPWDPGDDGWVQVDTPRVGLLGTAGWLTAHAHPDRPSAAGRGRWVMDQLLCTPPPPPPPNVEGSVDPQPGEGSVREQEEAQRADAYCQSCHGRMDPIGFALHGFDATGADRLQDELGHPIDDGVELDGVWLDGAADLAAELAADPRLPRCAVIKTLTFALGRPPRPEDTPEIDRITEAFVDGGSRFEALAIAIATSDPFLLRAASEVE